MDANCAVCDDEISPHPPVAGRRNAQGPDRLHDANSLPAQETAAARPSAHKQGSKNAGVFM